MLAMRKWPRSRCRAGLSRTFKPGALLTGLMILTACGIENKHEFYSSDQSENFSFSNRKNPNFDAGLNYLNTGLKNSNMVGDVASRRRQGMLHWNPGRCTSPRGPQLEINPQIESFDRKNAYWLSWLSIQAYRQGDDALNHLSKVGLTNVDFVSDNSSGFHAFVGSTETYTVVSFAGTSEFVDYLTDLTFANKPETMPGVPGLVHIGFLNVLERSWPQLLALVNKHSLGRKPLLLTGHSMGGAQAVMSATRLAKLGYHIDSLYIFAVPRIGDDTYAHYVESLFPNRIWRFVNNEDFVPRLPPPPIAADAFSRVFPGASQEAVKTVFESLRYKHIGQLLIQDGRGGLSTPRAFDESEDVAYWENVFNRTKGLNVPQAIFANWRMVFDHIPFASHCQLNPPKKSPFQPVASFIDSGAE